MGDGECKWKLTATWWKLCELAISQWKQDSLSFCSFWDQGAPRNGGWCTWVILHPQTKGMPSASTRGKGACCRPGNLPPALGAASVHLRTTRPKISASFGEIGGIGDHWGRWLRGSSHDSSVTFLHLHEVSEAATWDHPFVEKDLTATVRLNCNSVFSRAVEFWVGPFPGFNFQAVWHLQMLVPGRYLRFRWLKPFAMTQFLTERHQSLRHHGGVYKDLQSWVFLVQKLWYLFVKRAKKSAALVIPWVPAVCLFQDVEIWLTSCQMFAASEKSSSPLCQEKSWEHSSTGVVERSSWKSHHKGCPSLRHCGDTPQGRDRFQLCRWGILGLCKAHELFLMRSPQKWGWKH